MLVDDRLLSFDMKRTNQAEDADPSPAASIPQSPTQDPEHNGQLCKDSPAYTEGAHAHADTTLAPTSVASVVQLSIPGSVGLPNDAAEQPNKEPKPRPNSDFTVKEQRRVVFSMSLVIFFACESFFGEVSRA